MSCADLRLDLPAGPGPVVGNRFAILVRARLTTASGGRRPTPVTAPATGR